MNFNSLSRSIWPVIALIQPILLQTTVIGSFSIRASSGTSSISTCSVISDLRFPLIYSFPNFFFVFLICSATRLHCCNSSANRSSNSTRSCMSSSLSRRSTISSRRRNDLSLMFKMASTWISVNSPSSLLGDT